MKQPDENLIDRHLERAAVSLWDQRAHLIAGQISALCDIAEYAKVPRSDLERSCERNVARVVSMLRNEDSLPTQIIEDERRSGARRAQQGIPAEVVVAAYRVVIGVIRDAFLDEAPTLNVPVEAMLTGIRRLWTLTDHFSSTLVSAHHEFALGAAREAEQRRVTFVRSVLDPTTDVGQILAEGREHGLRESGDYWVVRADLRADVGADEHRTLMRACSSADFEALLVRARGRAEGIAGQRPALPEDFPGTISVAGPVTPVSFSLAATESAKVLIAAHRFGIRGVIDRERLGIRLAIVENPQISEMLVARHIIPVRAASSMGNEVLATVASYLEMRSIPAAAHELSVHVNTVRYRLAKFEELTGADLSTTQGSFEVWWAISADKLVRDNGVTLQ